MLETLSLMVCRKFSDNCNIHLDALKAVTHSEKFAYAALVFTWMGAQYLNY